MNNVNLTAASPLPIYLFRLKEAVRTYENFFSGGARIYSVASNLGTSLLPTSMCITFLAWGRSGNT